MAPQWPEEVDVFSVPHSRMKKLVQDYRHLVSSTDFRNEYHMTDLLQNLIDVFLEFKNHERIENIYIMERLRRKLKAASVTSEAVCNCHSDNRLTEMLDLVVNGYSMAQKTAKERQDYGCKLQLALEDFTQNFIPHMEEEEEVFQPMLIKYFSYEELKELKASVIHQHSVSKQQGGEYSHEKCVQELYQSEESVKVQVESVCFANKLPNEVFNKIFQYLNPQDLARASQVSPRWNDLALDPSLWPGVYPVHWAKGNWTFDPQPLGGVDGLGDEEGDKMRFHEELDGEFAGTVDEDADVDELEAEDKDDDISSYGMKKNEVLKEARMLTGMVKFLLHRVGPGVKTIDLAYSKGVSSSLLHKILKLCKNVEALDVTQTRVGDAAFVESGLLESKLRRLDLTGCQNVTDQSLLSLAGIGYDDCRDFGDNHEKYTAANAKRENDATTVEIENVPPPCGEKKAACCGRAGVFGIMDGRLSVGTCDREVRDRSWCNDCPQISVVKNCAKKSSRCCDAQNKRVKGLEVNGLDCQDKNAVESISYSSSVSDTCCGFAIAPQMCERVDASIIPKGMVGRDVDESTPGETCCSSSSSPLLDSTCAKENFECCDGCNQSSSWPLAYQLSPHDGGSSADEFRCDCPEACSSADLNNESRSSYRCLGDGAEGFVTSDEDAATTTSSRSSSSSCGDKSSWGDCANGQDWCVAADEWVARRVPPLEYLSLNGCFNISDDGLVALAEGMGTPYLRHLDLSGCMGVTGYGLTRLMATCRSLSHSDLFYCDHLPGDPFPRTACGCRNLESRSRYCCTMDAGE